MKKLLLILAVLMLPASVFADHWVRSGTMEPGIYIACALLDDGTRPFCVNAYAVGGAEEAQGMCDTLNDEPMTMPGEQPIWFLWNLDTKDFKKVSHPCKYIEGTKM